RGLPPCGPVPVRRRSESRRRRRGERRRGGSRRGERSVAWGFWLRLRPIFNGRPKLPPATGGVNGGAEIAARRCPVWGRGARRGWGGEGGVWAGAEAAALAGRLPGEPALDGAERGEAGGVLDRALDGDEAREEGGPARGGGLDGDGGVLAAEHVEDESALEGE